MYFVPRILGGVDHDGSGTSIMAPWKLVPFHALEETHLHKNCKKGKQLRLKKKRGHSNVGDFN